MSVPLQPGFGLAIRAMWLLNWKQKLSWKRLPFLLGLILAFPCLVFYVCSENPTETYLTLVTQFYLLVLPLYCLYQCGGMIRDEVQADTLSFLITRPLTRSRLLLAEYLSQMAWLQMIALGNGLLLIAVGALRHVTDIYTIGGFLFIVQFLSVLVYSALSTLLGLIYSRYFVMGIVYGFIVEVGVGRIPTNINVLSMSHHLQTILANHETILKQFPSWDPQGTAFSVFMIFLATAIFLAAASMLFTFREYHHSEEMQK